MRTIILISLFFVLSKQSEAQTALTFSDVVKVDSTITKEQLFERARQWFATYFKDSKAVLQVSDKDNGELIGRGAIPFSSGVFVGSAATKGYINFDVKVYSKQGRYKYELTNFIHEGTSGVDFKAISFGLITTDSICSKFPDDQYYLKWQNKLWKEMKAKIESEIQPLIASLVRVMNSAIPSQKDDW